MNKYSQNKKEKNPPNLRAYNEGVKKGVNLALQDKILRPRKENPYNPLLRPGAFTSYSAGLKSGYKLGIFKRENRKIQLENIRQNKKETSRSRDR